MNTSRTVIHYGLCNRLKFERISDLFLEGSLDLGDDYLILTPNRYRKSELMERLSRANGQFSPPVLVFREFVAVAFRSLHPELKILERLQKQLLLAEIVGDETNLAYWSRLVASIKSRNITDAELLRLELVRHGDGLRPEDQEVIERFSDYQEQLRERAYEDWEGVYCGVHDGLVSGRIQLRELRPGLRSLIVELPVRLSPIESSIVSLLTGEVEQMHLLVPLETPDEATGSWSFLASLEGSRQLVPAAGLPEPCVLNHGDDRAELVWAVDWLRGRLREDANGGSVGVVSSLPVEDVDEVRRRLQAHGIRVTGHFPTPGHSRLVEVLLSYLRLLQGRFKRLELFDFLASARLATKLEKDQIRALEELAFRAGIVSGLEEWGSLLPPAARELEEELGLEGESCRVLLELLHRWEIDISRRLPFRDWYRQCADRLAPYLAFDSLEGGEGRLLAQFQRAVSAQQEILRNRPLSFQDFRGLCGECAGWREELAQQASARVWLGRPEELHNCEFEHILWLGLTDEAFPATITDPLSEEEVPAPFRTLSLQARHFDAELLFRNLLANARDVTLSYPRMLGERNMTPSPLLYGYPESAAREVDRTAPASPAAQENIEGGRRVQSLRESLQASSYAGFLLAADSRELARKTLWKNRILVSPTQLEHYAACGFRFLAERVLGLPPGDSPSGLPSPADLGELIHKILFRFRKETYRDPARFPPDDEESWIQRQSEPLRLIAEEEIGRLRNQYRWGKGLLGNYYQSRLLSGLRGGDSSGILLEFLRREWKWGRWNRPLAEELRAGPTLLGDFQDPEGRVLRVYLRGRLDRVDRGERGLVVIDYKTGEDVRGRCYQGWGYQLPLYRLLAEDSLGESVSDAFFYALRFPQQVRAERLRMPREERERLWGELSAFYRDRALDLTRQLHQGAFPPTLLSRSLAGCRSCRFREVCRYEGAQASRLRQSGELLSRSSLLEGGLWVDLPSTRRSPALEPRLDQE